MVGAGTPAESVSCSLLEEEEEEEGGEDQEGGGACTQGDAQGHGHFTNAGTAGQRGNHNSTTQEEGISGGQVGSSNCTDSQRRRPRRPRSRSRSRPRRRGTGSGRSGPGGGGNVTADGVLSPYLPDGSTASVLCPTTPRDSGCWTPTDGEDGIIGALYCESLEGGIIESLGSVSGKRRDSPQVLPERSMYRRKSDGLQQNAAVRAGQRNSFSRRKEQLPSFPLGVGPSDSLPTSAAKQRAMPKAHYERYKKEIMRKLARTLHTPNGGDTKDNKGITEGAKDSEGHVKLVSSSSPNLAIPASWRLPVGWAGRNKSFLAASRDRSQRHRDNNPGGTTTEDRQRQSATTTAKGPSPLSVLNRSSANAFRDRSHFTRSWVQNSFSAVHPLTFEEEGPEAAGGGGGAANPHRMRMGHNFLHGTPNDHYDPDAESSLDPPSRIQTDGVMRPLLHGQPETSRTGLTSQSFPKDGVWPAPGQRRKRRRSRGQNNGRVPLSRNMNTFSRMSLEAQAALKDMGVAPPIDDDSSDGSESEAKDKVMAEVTQEENPPTTTSSTVKVTPGVASGAGSRVASRSTMPNLRSSSGDKQNKPLVFYQHQHGNVYQSSKNAEFAHILSDRNKGQNKVKSMKESNTRHASITGNIANVDEGMRAKKENKSHITITVSMDNSNKDDSKECTCDMKNLNIRNSKAKDRSVAYLCPNCESQIAEESIKKAQSQGSKTRMRLPNIRESPTGSVTFGNKTEQTGSTTPFFGTHRHIPGIGQYKMHPANVKSSVATFTKENTFEITPVGYDSRFEDIIKKDDELDDTPEEIRQKAIEKCNDWLKKYH